MDAIPLCQLMPGYMFSVMQHKYYISDLMTYCILHVSVYAKTILGYINIKLYVRKISST